MFKNQDLQMCGLKLSKCIVNFRPLEHVDLKLCLGIATQVGEHNLSKMTWRMKG